MTDAAAVGSLLAPALPYLLRRADSIAAQAARHVQIRVAGDSNVTIVDAEVDRTTIVGGDVTTTGA